MKLEESLIVNAAIEDVWALIDDESLWPAWNPKVKEIKAASAPPRRVGYTFRVVNQMGTKLKESAAFVQTREPPLRLAVRYTPEGSASGASVVETFELSPHGQHETRVRHVVDFSSAGLPWWARVAIKLISLIGSPVGKGPLDGLKDAAEPH